MSSPSLNTFEILITDELNKSEISTVQSLANALAYSEKIWKSPKINIESQNISIEDKVLGIQLKSVKVKSENTSFLINIQYQDVKEIEAFKKNLYQHISGKLGFSLIKVTADSVSEQISTEMQPYILSAEKAVKRAILESALLSTGIAALNLPKTISDKIRDKKSFSGFSKNIDILDFLLVDFEDLSELITKDASLKNQIGQKWAKLAFLKDQAVANVLLTASDLAETKTIATQLIELVSGKPLKQTVAVNTKTEKAPAEKKAVAKPAPVKKAAPEATKTAPVVKASIVKEKPAVVENKIEDKPIVTPAAEVQKVIEKEVVVEKPKPTPAQSNGGSLMITEDTFLEELKKMENQKAGQKINLKTFVSETLASLGYTTGPAYFASRNLSESGKVEVFDTKDETGLIFKAVKSL
jgi:hypothetical protein